MRVTGTADAMRTRHIWRQHSHLQLRGTTWQPDRLHYFYGWRRPSQGRRQAQLRQERAEQWRPLSSCSTTSDRKAVEVRKVRELWPGREFRLVDQHGKSYGARYQLVRFGCGGAFVDCGGLPGFLPLDARCRYIDRCAEDPHSAACRALKREWRANRNSKD